MINPKCKRTKSCSVSDDFVLALKKGFSGSKAEKLPPDSHYPLYIGENLISQLKSIDNQIVWGRRGTGKTHLLKAFNQCINEDEFNYSISYYISCDKIRYETPISVEFKDDFEKMKYCARNTFRYFMMDLIEQIMNNYEEILCKKSKYKNLNSIEKRQMKKKIEDSILDIISNVYEGIPNVIELSKTVKYGESKESTRTAGIDLKTSVGSEDSSFKLTSILSWFKKREKKTESLKTKQIVYEFSFQRLQHSFSSLSEAMGVSAFYICIDELWLIDDKSTISYQPLFLDYLRQTFFGIHNMSIKIASIRETTKLNSKNTVEQCYGIQPGHDIIELANLDSMRYTKEALVSKFTQILVSRINYFSEERKKSKRAILYDGDYIVQILFNHKRYLSTLIYLAHGIPRNVLYILRSCLATISYDLSKYYLHIYLLSDTIIANYMEEKRANMPMNENSVFMLINKYTDDSKNCFFLINTEQVKQYKTEINNLLYTEIIHRIPSSLTPNGIMDKYKAYFVDSGKYFSLIKEKVPQQYERILSQFELSIPENLDSDHDQYTIDLNNVPNNFIQCPNCSATFNSNHPVYAKFKCCITCGFDL